MQAPCGDSIVRSRFADHKAVNIASIVASPAEQIRDLQAMHAVFFDLQFANDIGRATVERRPIVRVTIAGRLHWRSDVGELSHVRDFLFGAFTGDMLHEN